MPPGPAAPAAPAETGVPPPAPTRLPSALPAQAVPAAPLRSPRVTALPPEAPAVPSTASGPAVPRQLAGTARHGMRLSVEQVVQRFPALATAQAEQVARLLQGTVAETFTRRDAADWGVPAQRRYGELVEQALQLAQQPAVQTAQAELRRLHAVLAEVSQAIEQQLQPGLLARWRAADPWQLLQRHRTEIDQLRAALGQAVPLLAAQAEALAGVRRDLQALSADIEAHGLAATLLGERIAAPGQGDMHQLLLGRATDLAQTHAHVAGTDPLRAHAGEQLADLAGAIRQAVLLLLPAWLEKALHARHVAPTPTLARRLQQELDTLLHSLRPT